MNYWLMKSEPDVFSIDHLAQEKKAGWDGVRNYQARNFMKAMKAGDQAFFYHSNAKPPAIVGLMRIVREAYPETGPWVQVDVEFVRKFEKPLSLENIKKIPSLKNMILLRHSRLSVQPVTPRQWEDIMSRS